MVRINKVYTRKGDDGSTGLAVGPRRSKADARMVAIGDVDETNVVIGLVQFTDPALDETLAPTLRRIQNDLFDLGADLSTPGEPEGYAALRIAPTQVGWVEERIDELNDGLEPLRTFVLPTGALAATQLHHARTVCRRAERAVVALAEQEDVSEPLRNYLNRLSDLLFVMARYVNVKTTGEVLWVPGANR